jgi:hypothetical protein
MTVLHMSLPTENPDAVPPFSVGLGGGGLGGDTAALAVPFIHQDRYWCANCAGERTFVLVDRFPCGWRGYCLGCEETKYVMDSRENSEGE